MSMKDNTSKYFMGRRNELAFLENSALLAGSGDASSIILAGDKGIGKTELLKRFTKELNNGQNGIVPFYFLISNGGSVVENFAYEYLASFLEQYIAFTTEGLAADINKTKSLDELRVIAKEAKIEWAVKRIDAFYSIREKENSSALLAHSVNSPLVSYKVTGSPVYVLLDDFHYINSLCCSDRQDSIDVWMLFQSIFQSGYVPHIISGLPASLDKMCFEDSKVGEELELLSLEGLRKSDSLELCKALCSKYSLSYDESIRNIAEWFEGNPFYMNAFIQAACQTVHELTAVNFKEIYIREITRGKIYRAWTGALKQCVDQFEMRRSSLDILNLLSDGSQGFSPEMQESLSLQKDDINYMIDKLNRSGAIDMGFCTAGLSGGKLFSDLVKALYHKEVLKESFSLTADLAGHESDRYVGGNNIPSFDISIPGTSGSEHVAVSSLEQVAKHFQISSGATGQMQLAMVELFDGVFGKNGSSDDSYQVRFSLKDSIFSIRIKSSQPELFVTEKSISHIKRYADGVEVEKDAEGSIVTLTKKLD